MDKDLFEDLEESIRQMKAIQAGKMAPGRVRIYADNEVTAARAQLGMTQEQFAALLGTPVTTVRGWEQGRRKPNPAVRLLIKVARKRPDVILDCA